MNNQEKNSYVRRQITDALLRLLQKQKLDEINVSQLTKEAGVGRVSFYRNYKDLPDILYQRDKLLLKQWETTFECDPNSSIANVFGSLFQHYKDHADFYMILYRNGLTNSMLETIKEKCEMSAELPNAVAYQKAFFAYGLYGWLMEWIGRGMQEDATAINAMLKA